MIAILQRILLGALLILSSLVCADQSVTPLIQTENSWFKQGQQFLNDKRQMIRSVRQAKNVILFVGDGMGVTTVTAARILEGQLRGGSGEENLLSFERFPVTGMSKTYNVNAQTPDSAGTMTAMITGVKTNAGVLGLSEQAHRANCMTHKGHELITALELAELAGMATGIVTTARVTHATPAATYAKSVERNWEDNSIIPAQARELGCIDIALQLVQFEQRLKQHYPQASAVNGIDVVFGGGRRHFLPDSEEFQSIDHEGKVPGQRTDNRNLLDEWQVAYPSGQVLHSIEAFDLLNAYMPGPVLGLFADSNMRYEQNRHHDSPGEPSLSAMTGKAIDLLENESGFFLMVEGGRIDHGHHAGSAYNALHDTIEFSNAVKVALDKVNLDETLVLVTADHSHVFTMAGYSRRGNPILGKAKNLDSDEPVKALDGLPYTTLGYANGPGFGFFDGKPNADEVNNREPVKGRVDLSKVDTTAPGFFQEAKVPLASETHGGEDVVVYAAGPNAMLATGVYEQNYVFHIMNSAARLAARAQKNLETESKTAIQQ